MNLMNRLIAIGLLLSAIPLSYTVWAAYGEFQADAYTKGLWLLNETSGTNVADSSGNGHAGTASGTQSIVNGWFGNGRNFGGGYVGFTDHADFTIDGTVSNTWEFVLIADTLQNWNTFFATYVGTYLLMFVLGDSDYPAARSDAVIVYYEDGGVSSDAYTTQNILSASTWYYVAIVYTSGGTWTIYLNGVNRTLDSSCNIGSSLNPTTTRFASETMYSTWFDGTIDMVRWRPNYQASAAEIRQTWSVIKGAYGIHD